MVELTLLLCLSSSFVDAVFSIPPLGETPCDPILDGLSVMSVAFTHKFVNHQPPWTSSLLEPAVDARVEPDSEDDVSSAESSSSGSQSQIDWANLPEYTHKVSVRDSQDESAACF